MGLLWWKRWQRISGLISVWFSLIQFDTFDKLASGMLAYFGTIFTYLIFECPLNIVLLGPFLLLLFTKVLWAMLFYDRLWHSSAWDLHHGPEVHVFSRIYENIQFQGFTKIYCWQIRINFESALVNSFYFRVILLNFGVVLRVDRLTATNLVPLFIEAKINVKDWRYVT